MQGLGEEIQRKRPDLLQNNLWLLHHDNALAHHCLFVIYWFIKKIKTAFFEELNTVPKSAYPGIVCACIISERNSFREEKIFINK